MCYTKTTNKEGGLNMQKLNSLWLRYGTSSNLRLLYILLGLIALAVAGGAPSNGGGGSGGGM